MVVNNSSDEKLLHVTHDGDTEDITAVVTSISLLDGYDILATLQEGIPINAHLVPQGASVQSVAAEESGHFVVTIKKDASPLGATWGLFVVSRTLCQLCANVVPTVR